MKNIIKYAVLGAAIASITPVQAEKTDCYKLYNAVKKSVSSEPGKVLEIVKTNVAQNESCACEVVKAAIVASGADKKLVAGIVEAAIAAAPSKVRIIGQCAVAVAPDALAEVQAVVTKYAAASGDSGYSAKGGEKGAKDAVASPDPQNVLDFPLGGNPTNLVGPTTGGPGGFPLFPPALQPPSVTPPSSTD